MNRLNGFAGRQRPHRHLHVEEDPPVHIVVVDETAETAIPAVGLCVLRSLVRIAEWWAGVLLAALVLRAFEVV